MKFILQKVEASDFQTLFKIKRLAYGDWIKLCWGWDEVQQIDYFKKTFEEPELRKIVVTGKIAGIISVKNKSDHGLIDSLFIHPDFQSQGLGAAVIESYFPKFKYLKLSVLKQNKRAQKFYKKLGFKPSEEPAEHDHNFVMIRKV